MVKLVDILEINIKLRMLNFWVRLLTNQTKLSSILYQLLYNMQINEVCNFKWLNYVQSIFDDVGLSYVWNNQFVLSSTDMNAHAAILRFILRNFILISCS